MFGYVVGGRPVQTTVQTISQTKYFFQIENATDAKDVAIFLMDPVNFPIGFNAAIYLSWKPFTEWKYLGFLNQTKPSSIFTIIQQLDKTMALGEDKNTIQIGISIENDQEIQAKVIENQLNDNMIFKSTDFKQFAYKMCHNLVNYILSFSGDGVPSNMVPATTVNKWYENFQKKLQNDALFWK
ncbi:hypothetical protein DICPUDRAFT_99175 [Dictyostelium purpureum]|uniref:Uncharacterized protein n=1 Tax=Dictyostelium purpureum TaxID=5786 RepID=F0ZWV1_DICPU|nr:uncharacterized protein DICPUDRAFT_99175 [Dictyostelium purpureum]EGC31579.1 hypothetical protein DICPUDRAFT_99175 [Dictyostelium purpureum]|eukprot:XP_003291890.1 hypothetical protein DICPUDRAFT_99175 [Dictyostelium purpureum]